MSCSVEIIERIVPIAIIIYVITVYFSESSKSVGNVLQTIRQAVVLENVTGQDVSRPAEILHKKLYLNIYIYI